jgi:hypothetical protein
MEERRAAPAFFPLTPLIGAAVFGEGWLVRLLGAPAESTALIDRMQRVDEADGASERHAGSDATLAKLAQEHVLARAGKPAFCQPMGNVFDVGGTHAPLYTCSAPGGAKIAKGKRSLNPMLS